MNGVRLGGLLLVVSLGGCKVELPPDATFSCRTEQDCDGDGYLCLTEGRQVGLCCKPSAEVCDGKDNDCNGQVDDAEPTSCYSGPEGTGGIGECRAGTQGCEQGAPGACAGEVVPTAELCNLKDDDCDGQVDEDFDLSSNAQHCGVCGRDCGADMKCANGECSTSIERNCSDGVDDEGDTKIDCADDDCEADPCGTGCTCKALAKSESDCSDGVDNESDGPIDCLDTDCEGLSCGAGCTCAQTAKKETGCADGMDNDGDGQSDCADSDCDTKECGEGCVCAAGKKKETACRDAKDNDGDGAFDCVDADCVNELCKPSPQTFVCNASGQCVCNGAVNPSPEVNAQCTDGVDNNCNGKVDCEEVGCNNQSCGTGCTCKLGARTESLCDDFNDNDGDGKSDCMDTTDCPVNTACKFMLGMTPMNGTCRSDGTCQ